MYAPPSAGTRLPLCEHTVAPAGSAQYWTMLVVTGARSLVFAHAMYAVPEESTATAGGPLSNGVPTLTGVLTASALAANASVANVVSAATRVVRWRAAPDALIACPSVHPDQPTRNMLSPFVGPRMRRSLVRADSTNERTRGRARYALAGRLQ